ncbi:haloacid dehalogenase [Geotalea uraniireducens]|uniref:Phosphoglycolate phosphatase n=1 Tax=Geotalea uraniireducens TaxID=351604 RepID=A0ABN6VTU9_9BACT|nr:HAD-IA family hydrolase [Geotalea uraniireducens]BDV42606.1 haloacid dehalogenase [Geotalea uraniireducens]
MSECLDLVIFDLDGTLVDSLADLTTATNEMLAVFGRQPLDETGVRALVGQGARRLVERALAGATSTDVDRGVELFLQANLNHLVERSALYPGAAETLAALRARGMRLAVVSNKHVALCRRILSLLGIGDYFAEILGADSLPFRKPSPEPVLKLLADFGVAATRAGIVGDSVNDVAAGKGAGVATVGCTWGYGGSDDLVEADYRIDTFSELLALPLFCHGARQ